MPDGGGLSLREAVGLSNALPGADTISFDPGVFSGGANSLIRLTRGTIEISDALTVEGRSATGVTISGDLLGNDVTIAGTALTDVPASDALLADNRRLFLLNGPEADTVFAGLTLTGGNTVVTPIRAGGAISSAEADITILDSTLIGNRATRFGGAVYSDSGTVRVERSSIGGNQTEGPGGKGGGLFAREAPLTVIDSLVNANATTRAFSYGGGLYAGAGLTLQGSTVVGNSTAGAYAYGGGLFARGGDVTITDSTITGNSTSGALGVGGGLHIATSGATLTNSVVSGNFSAASTANEIFSPSPITLTGGNIVGGDVYAGDLLTGAATAGEIFAATVETRFDDDADGDPESPGGVFGGAVASNGGPVDTVALRVDRTNPTLTLGGDPAPRDDGRGPVPVFPTDPVQPVDTSGTFSKKPNIVYLMADDLGLGDLNPTFMPRSYALMEELGTQLNFQTAAKCAPSRTALMTGKDPDVFAMRGNYTAENFPGLPPGEILLSERFQDAGYATGLFGKWHLGLDPAQAPWNQGFDHSIGFLHGQIEYFGVNEDPAPGFQLYDDRSIGHSHQNGHDMLLNGTPIHSTQYSTFLFADAAKEWIADRAGGDEAFFAYVPFNAPHTPYSAPRAYVDLYRDYFKVTDAEYALLATYAEDVLAIPRGAVMDDATRTKLDVLLYYAAVRAMDDAIADIYQGIVDAGIAKDTVFMFASDNGPRTFPPVGSAGPLRGGKGTPNEGGHRTPNFIIWPEEIAAGEDIDENVWIGDLYPTFLNIAGIDAGPDLDGVDVTPALRGEDFDRGVVVPHVWVQYSRVVVSLLDGDLKYIRRTMVDRDADRQINQVHNIVEELYDLSVDIGETINVAGDPAYAAALASLRASYAEYGSGGLTGDAYFFAQPLTQGETPVNVPEEWGSTLSRSDPGIIKYGSGSTDVIIGEADSDTIMGAGGDDTLRGEGDDDLLMGGDGNDFLLGGLGNDRLQGESGDDRLNGDGGADQLFDGLGNNTLDGGVGADSLVVLSGTNDLNGGASDDFLVGGAQADSLAGGPGNDVIRGDVAGFFGGSDTIAGGTGNDLLMGGPGADRFVFTPGDGSDTIGVIRQNGRAFDAVSNRLGTTGDADFVPGQDLVELSGFQAISASSLRSFLEAGLDGTIFRAEGVEITFDGVQLGALTSSSFLFT